MSAATILYINRKYGSNSYLNFKRFLVSSDHKDSKVGILKSVDRAIAASQEPVIEVQTICGPHFCLGKPVTWIYWPIDGASGSQ